MKSSPTLSLQQPAQKMWVAGVLELESDVPYSDGTTFQKDWGWGVN